MKKCIISLVVVFAMLVMTASLSVFGENINNSDKEYLFDHLIVDESEPYHYDELYYHYVSEGDFESGIEWAIIWYKNGASPMEYSTVIANRRISVGSICYPFHTGYAIYDAQLNEIIDIEKADIFKYPDFEKGLEEARVGNPFGDADMDSKLTVMDATFIQRALAQMCEFSKFDDTYYKVDGVALKYISDFDRDGERTVLDATAIQHKLAGLEY